MATQYVTCPRCQSQNSGLNTLCTNCGAQLPIAPMPMQQVNYGQAKPAGADKKIAAGLCGILLGSFGVHKFILGYQQEGIIMLAITLVAWVITFVTCGIGAFLVFIPSIIGLVEGIMYLTKSDEEFVQTYIINKKPWF
ncbi:MAG: TM2 domain-containing protein [Pyrinomonadaceae bacterium]|nr:TM2 domain-containing protein [Pyrinomonadaceae bacterium]